MKTTGSLRAALAFTLALTCAAVAVRAQVAGPDGARRLSGRSAGDQRRGCRTDTDDVRQSVLSHGPSQRRRKLHYPREAGNNLPGGNSLAACLNRRSILRGASATLFRVRSVGL